MIRRTLLLAPCVALSLALVACGGDRPPEPSESPTAPSTAAPSAPYVTPSDEETATPGEPQDDSLVNAEGDDAAQQGARDAALATATVWVQGKTLDQDEWNRQLLDTLAPIARPAYDGTTWGYRIEQTAITGDPVVAVATMTTATVTVPTDHGDLSITVSRDDESAPWLTTSITTTAP